MIPDDASIVRLDPEADLSGIVEIERASFNTPWTPDMFRWELRNSDVSSTYVVKTADGTIAAFCCIWLVLDELHINNIAVRPAFRRRGFALDLLTYVIALAAERGARKATLEVRRSNAPALQLYERLGFSVAGVRKNYYTNPVEDALVLWCSVEPPVSREAGPAR